jgi:hypothetical protein
MAKTHVNDKGSSPEGKMRLMIILTQPCTMVNIFFLYTVV